MTETIINQNMMASIQDIFLYQNKILIRQISENHKWNLSQLKKFIPQSIKSKNKIMNVKKTPSTSSEDSEGEVKILRKRVIVKRKKSGFRIKKVKSLSQHTLKEDDLLCLTISYLGKTYYLDPETQNVYQMVEEEGDEIEFVGMLEGNSINFDAESAI